MGILIKLFASLVIAAGICGMLIFTGVLELDSKQVKKTEAEIHLAQNELGHKEAPKESLAASYGEMPKAVKQKADIKRTESEAAANAPNTLTNQSKSAATPDKQYSSGMDSPKTYISIDENIHRRALSYLYFLAKDPPGNTERRFSKFLKTEFDLDEKTIDQILQMTFWKNFLVFQKKGSIGDAKALKQVFEREVELKKAGFEAKGLKLMTAEINAAKSRLSDVEQQLAGNSGNQSTSAERAQ